MDLNENKISVATQKQEPNIVFTPRIAKLHETTADDLKFAPLLPKMTMIPVRKAYTKSSQPIVKRSPNSHNLVKQESPSNRVAPETEKFKPQLEKLVTKLSCNYCRTTRTKCDRKEPCGRCEAKNLVCETTSLDLRKKRVKAGDIERLELRVKELETQLALKMGQSIVVDGLDVEKQSIGEFSTGTLEKTLTSFYNPSKDEHIIKAIKNFFTFLYPGLTMFIHRESFLHSFFNEYSSNYKESKYCSIELVYAVAALGCRLSEDLQQFSDKYFTMAKEGVLQNRVFPKNTANSVSLITSVQTLLALSLYELGNGNFGQCFYLSGIAFRIGFDMSFQLDPSAWFNPKFYASEQPTAGFGNQNSVTKEDIEIRSRIYWGCYLTDHFICLVLGRNPTLFCFNSTIKDSIEMSETEQTEDFKFQSKHTLLVSIPLKQLIILSRIVEIFTKGFFIEPNIRRDKKLQYLAKFNAKIETWKSSLPGFLKWDQFSINDPSYSSDPTITYFWYHYYIVVLTFNKPYVEENSVVIRNTLDSLQIMLTNFVNLYDKFNLYQLFSVSIALNILAKYKNIVKTNESIQYVDDKIYFFNTILRKLSSCYGFATKLVEMHAYDDTFTSDTSSSDVNFVYSKYSQHAPENSNSYLPNNESYRGNSESFKARPQEAGSPDFMSQIDSVLEQPKRKRHKNSSTNAANSHFESSNAILSMLLNNQYNTDVDELTSLLLKNNEKTTNEINHQDQLKFINFKKQIETETFADKQAINNNTQSFKKHISQNDDTIKSLFSKAPQGMINNITHTNDFSLNLEVDEIIKKMFMDDDPEFEKFMNPAHSL
ncbi:hypothetical protein QEN19_003854 [Hanseniaspora menglaensis]